MLQRSALVGALLLLGGCGSGPSLHYHVTFPADAVEGVAVRLEIVGAPRDSLVLESYEPAARMRLKQVEALDGDRRLGFTTGVQRIYGASGTTDYVALRIAGPVPPRVEVRYTLGLGQRVGNEHTGFSGERAGFAGAFAFAGGRSLFLVPRGTHRSVPIGVSYQLPLGWSALAPWRRQGDTWTPGGPGRAPVADLLQAALGFGHFDERTVTLGGTRFRFAVEAGIGRAEADSAVSRLQSIAGVIVETMGRGLGRDFTTVIVPETWNGDEVAFESWANGAGGTLAPLTTARARRFAEGLIDAYLTQAPYRAEVRDPKQRWVAVGVRRLLPWRALERCGLSRPEDLERSLAVDYAKALDEEVEGDDTVSLEGLSPDESGGSPGPEAAAAITLLRIDQGIREETAGRESLEVVLGRVFGSRAARSLWVSLPHPRASRWAALRAGYVRGRDGLGVDPLFGAAPMKDAPSPGRGPVRQRLILAYTGDTYGYLENCGCTVNQAGGVARRSTVLGQLRRRSPLLLLDAGNALARPAQFDPPDYLAREEEKLYLRTMSLMGYGMAALGPAELAYGVGRFREAEASSAFPFVLANARDSAGSIAPAWQDASAGGVRLGVVGLLEPGRGPWADDVFERHVLGRVRFDDPVETMKRLLPEVRPRADLVVAMGQLSPPTVRRLVRECPDLDVVISTDDEAGIRVVEDGDTTLSSSDAQGFIGQTLVLYTTQSSYGVNSAALGLDRSRRIASASLSAHWLGGSVQEDRAIRDVLTRFYDEVGSSPAAQASVPPLFPDDSTRHAGRYVGAARCGSCHKPEYDQWKGTAHADAYRTLLDVHRHYQPRCIVCHVVGYGTPHGYRLGSSDERLVNVQCEVCHGPGGDHVSAPRAANIRRATPEGVCLQCHTPDHSDHFVYQEALPRVVHTPAQDIRAGREPGAAGPGSPARSAAGARAGR